MGFRLRPVYNEGRYIKAQTFLQGISLKKIADNLGVSRASMHCVVYGRRRSKRIEAEIARVLGKASWNDVVLEARSEIQKKPVKTIIQEIQAETDLDMTSEEILAYKDWGPYLKQMRKEAAEAQAEQKHAKRRGA